MSKVSSKNSNLLPLTLNKPSGNASTSNNLTGWSHAEKLNYAYGPDAKGVYGRRGPWVKGHIIHHNLGGDGLNNNNLFIIQFLCIINNSKVKNKIINTEIKNINNYLYITYIDKTLKIF